MTDIADLTDEIAEAISDSLDMDWQPKWAAPAIIAIIERETKAAFEEGAKAMQEAANDALDVINDMLASISVSEERMRSVGGKLAHAIERKALVGISSAREATP